MFFKALKGQLNLAKGKALGNEIFKNNRPERAN
jgi:hypothetical protein